MQRGEIGKRLRRLRDHRGVSQNWLANKVHVSRQAISKYENGRGIDAELADEVLKSLGGIMVLGIDLEPDEALKVASYIGSLRKEKLRKERVKQNAVFEKHWEKEKEKRGNR